MTNPSPEGGKPMYVRRNGLLVPSDAADATQLRGQLSGQRDLVAVERDHQWRALALNAQHEIQLADVAEHAARAKRARKQRAKDARDAIKLDDLYRTAKHSGARAKIRAEILGSAEMRALRVAKVRTVALIAGLPILLAFAAWSTTGVQGGVVKLLSLPESDPSWWSAWAVEPALIAFVALIIIGRAVLRSSGGDTDWKADLAEWAALGTSLSLNMYGGWDGSGWSGFGTALTHSIGPIFAAGTAFSIGLFDGYVTQAKPWDGAPRIDDLDLMDVSDDRHDAPDAALQVPEMTLPPLPSDAPGKPELTQGDSRADAPTHRRRGARGGNRSARRPKPASTAATSTDAGVEDAATRAAKLVLTQGLGIREAARQVPGTSEGTVRRRLKDMESGAPTTDPANAASAEIVMTPIPDPKPAVTQGVNGHSLTTPTDS